MVAVFRKKTLFRKQTKEFLPWDEYSERMSVWELHKWQQDTRKQSLRNLVAQEGA